MLWVRCDVNKLVKIQQNHFNIIQLVHIVEKIILNK